MVMPLRPPLNTMHIDMTICPDSIVLTMTMTMRYIERDVDADANITCDFGDGNFSRFRSRLPNTRPHAHGHIVSSIIVRYSLL